MAFIFQIKKKIVSRYRRHVLRDPFLLEAARWFKDRGDHTLRVNYPLNTDSVVFDLGGYLGDFAATIHEKYKCRIYIFEPVPEFFQICVNRFKNTKGVACLNYGLAATDGRLKINLAGNASSFNSRDANGLKQTVDVRSIAECIRELRVNKIDLMKINVEGGEFDIIPALIHSEDIKIVDHLQVQFHNFIDNAAEKRQAIQSRLDVTHSLMWNYDFIWESWKLKGSAP